MDRTTEKLVSYAATFSGDAITPSAREETRKHLVDSVACAIAGHDCEAAQIARRLAHTVRADEMASIFGDGSMTTPELAAFANTIMVRAWDWNDGMHASGGGHPSDMISALLAVAEAEDCSPADTFSAIVLSYEILGALGTSAPIRELGYDQGTFMCVAAALGIGHLLGLDETQLANVVGLTVVPYVPLFVTRVGALSMWKGCSTAAAMRNAIFSVNLAREGMTGPAEPFEGKHGVWDQVSGPFDFTLPANPGGPLIVELSYMKMYPAEGPSQALLGAVPKIREFTTIDEVEAIEIETFRHAYQTMASHPAKWDPDSRETADHSLPYLLTVAIADGEISRASFTPERISDPSLRPIMQRVKIRENEAFTAEYAPPGSEIFGTPRARITVRKRNGEELVQEVTYPKGHSKNPMTVEDIDAKLDAACSGVVSDAHLEEIRAAWWNFESAGSVAEVVRTLSHLGG